MNAHMAMQKLLWLSTEAPFRLRRPKREIIDRLKVFAEDKWKPWTTELSDDTLDAFVDAGLCTRKRRETLTKSGGLYSERITYTWKGPPLKIEAVEAWLTPGPRAPKLRDQLELLRERDFLKPEKVKIGNKSVFFLGTTPDPDYPDEKQVWCVEWSTGKVLGVGDTMREAAAAAKLRK